MKVLKTSNIFYCSVTEWLNLIMSEKFENCRNVSFVGRVEKFHLEIDVREEMTLGNLTSFN